MIKFIRYYGKIVKHNVYFVFSFVNV